MKQKLLNWLIISSNPNTIKSYKNYLQNTQHMVLRNRPTLSIGTERLACLNSPPPPACNPGPSPSTWQVPGSSPGPGGRAARAFFSPPPSLPPSGETLSSSLLFLPQVSHHGIQLLAWIMFRRFNIVSLISINSHMFLNAGCISITYAFASRSFREV